MGVCCVCGKGTPRSLDSVEFVLCPSCAQEEEGEEAMRRMGREVGWQLLHASFAGQVKVGAAVVGGVTHMAVFVYGDLDRIKQALVLDMWRDRKLCLDGVWMKPTGDLIERDPYVCVLLKDAEA